MSRWLPHQPLPWVLTPGRRPQRMMGTSGSVGRRDGEGDGDGKRSVAEVG